MKGVYFILGIIFSSFISLSGYSQNSSVAGENISLAAANIISQLIPTSKDGVILINSKQKNRMAHALVSELRTGNIPCTHYVINKNQDSLTFLSSLIKRNPDKKYFIFLIDPSDAGFLFDNVGRPDMGFKIPENSFFCDWLISEDEFIRINSIDLKENHHFQEKLLSFLNTVDTIYITSEAGTDIRFIARNWITDKGEIYCTPYEDEINGIIIVDGCAYWGPPVKPVKLIIRNGRVVNIDDLSESDKQEQMIRKDFTTDENASVLCEVGIGTKKNVLWNSDVMEAEQSRGTCHFGFGMNIHYGGMISSKKHFDLVVLKPNIKINGTIIYEKGVCQIEQH